MCAHVKDPISIYRKRVDLTAVGMVHENTAQKGEKPLCSAVVWLLAFPGESSPNVACIAINGIRKLSNLI